MRPGPASASGVLIMEPCSLYLIWAVNPWTMDVIPDQIRNNRAEQDIYATIKASHSETITATGSDAERVALYI